MTTDRTAAQAMNEAWTIYVAGEVASDRYAAWISDSILAMGEAIARGDRAAAEAHEAEADRLYELSEQIITEMLKAEAAMKARPRPAVAA